ncbi:hypothetical protein [Soonwooa sp.]|uniref:hypothetical protein n=1 Tax=Soonwooa sp. TaxID=1938592 RepID=UPI0028AC21B5|nr:hypothetical protein [Soonwooa sp.]
MKFKILLIFIFCVNLGFAQQAEIFKIKNYQVAELSDSLKESSGLGFIGEKLISFNDSGNAGDLFLLNPKTGKITDYIPTHLNNRDWEAITKDSANLYVADFGNNDGTRKDLIIYKIPFSGEIFKVDSTQVISYFYPDQKNFTSKNLNTDYDAEAVIFYMDKLQIFTKEWASRSVTRYEVDPNVFEQQPAKKLESYDTGFVVTDASYFDKKLYVVGYTKMTQVYLMIFEESKDGFFFSKKGKKYHLGSALSVGQIEGIAVNHDGIFISSELFKTPLGTVKPRLYFIPIEKLK